MYRLPRGTSDIFGANIEKWHWMEEKVREITRTFNYREMRTPIFEHSELFARSVGETTDIVEKEMYTFTDRGKRSLSLRPEGTAGIVRSYVEHKLYADPQPTKLYYLGPMFRYENPQAGRTRQFHQFGAEAFGSLDPALDAEVISLGMSFFASLGLQNVVVQINSVGDAESRPRYRQRLIDYFTPYEQQLSAIDRSRLHRNPLRILDSKDPATRELLTEVPSILNSLSKEAAEHFELLQQYLSDLSIQYVVDPLLVRGLDYYTLTAFEFYTEIEGAQAGTIGGGGRYNQLVGEIGGPDMPGIGFALGLERVMLACEKQSCGPTDHAGIDCYLITFDHQTKKAAVSLLQRLRQAGLTAEVDYLGRKMKAQLKAADRLQAKFALIIGEEELAAEKVAVKNLQDGQQIMIGLEQVIHYVKEQRSVI
ncbi:histidyl-tRNA synthetase [Seinonella peptonophila]|uniref:Histidine--tRNA ligase n=1 Tax=Seinonella peptonophila TaxID=112248 RepID=A0A1M4WB88_9BACL|nr:histidine--tRNA ligase [Seinonella peptonophila]SHE78353.1 histidyl-tRNA synthetase [Seinonella peptonophila]